MKNLPDHGDEFWAMFASNGDGNIVLTEISADDTSDDAPDDDVLIIAESMELTAT